MTDVIIVGGGLAGLLTGAELKRRGRDVVVLEAADRPGGVARTINDGGYLLEPAAGSLLLPTPELTPIFDAAGVRVVEALDGSKRRYVYDRDRLIEIPDSPAALLSRLIPLGAKLRAAREPWVHTDPGSDDESILDYLTRRFGPGMGRMGGTLMAHGVFGGDPARLSMRGAFPRIVAWEDAAGSLVRGAIAKMRSRPKDEPRVRKTVHVAPDGMAGLADDLARYLGDGFRPGRPVTAVERTADGWSVDGEFTARSLILALAPHRAAPLLPDDVSEVVDRGVTAPVAVIGIGGRAADVPLPIGFGALIGPDAGLHALGILFESQYAAGRAPAGHHLAKGIYGGAADPGVMKRTDDELVALMIEETSRVIGIPVQPTWTRVVRQTPGIPQYEVGHVAWMREIDERLVAHPGLHLAGWGYRGIGVSGLGIDAVRLADAITDEGG